MVLTNFTLDKPAKDRVYEAPKQADIEFFQPEPQVAVEPPKEDDSMKPRLNTPTALALLEKRGLGPQYFQKALSVYGTSTLAEKLGWATGTVVKIIALWNLDSPRGAAVGSRHGMVLDESIEKLLTPLLPEGSDRVLAPFTSKQRHTPTEDLSNISAIDLIARQRAQLAATAERLHEDLQVKQAEVARVDAEVRNLDKALEVLRDGERQIRQMSVVTS
ncbi:MAG: hypothetical protein KGL39_35200 [Patescibacteria group bacterium]|nr:hypothetical protein [Patescibacteria group bacterium]